MEIDNLEAELQDKEETIQRLTRNSKGLGTQNIQTLEDKYQEMFYLTRDRTNRLGGTLESTTILRLKEELASCQNQLEKAIEINTVMREHMSESRRQTQGSPCELCKDYEITVTELSRRLNIYESTLRRDLNGVLGTMEAKLTETGYSWEQMEGAVCDLRERVSRRERRIPHSSNRGFVAAEFDVRRGSQ